MDNKKGDGPDNDETIDKSNASVDNNSVNNKSDKAGLCTHLLYQLLERLRWAKLTLEININNIIIIINNILIVCSYAGNTKATTNSAKSNDDTDKNTKKSNDDAAGSAEVTALGEIPKIEEYIANTRIDGLQTLYQVGIISS